MGRLAVGQLVRGPFPFSGEDNRKYRPCIVVASWPFGAGTDVQVCMVTSQSTSDPNAIPISEADLVWTHLPLRGSVRPMYLFSGSESLFEDKGQVDDAMLQRILDTVRSQVGTS